MNSLRKFSMLLFAFVLTATDISHVTTFGYQLQYLDEPGAVDALVDSRYDMLVLEPLNTEQDMEWFDTEDMVSRCKASPGVAVSNKIVVAYIDIGEAEDWRYYWESWWVPPSSGVAGNPDFLVAADPDGWEGNYPVAYWDDRWQDIIINDSNSMLKRAIADGFDGIYMDWVEAYDDTRVMARAASDGVDAPTEMIAFIEAIRDTARRYNPDFLVIAQNAADLSDDHPEYFDVIDAIAQEDLHFYGEADVEWGNHLAGDIAQDAEYRDYLITKLNGYLSHDLPVFTVEYSLIPANYNYAFTEDIALGYIPFITQTPLSQLPDYFPTGFNVEEKSLPESHALTVYPNPFNSVCHIEIPEGHKGLVISDLSGRQVLDIDDVEGIFQWKTSGVESGIYIVKTGDYSSNILYIQ